GRVEANRVAAALDVHQAALGAVAAGRAAAEDRIAVARLDAPEPRRAVAVGRAGEGEAGDVAVAADAARRGRRARARRRRAVAAPGAAGVAREHDPQAQEEDFGSARILHEGRDLHDPDRADHQAAGGTAGAGSGLMSGCFFWPREEIMSMAIRPTPTT